MKILIIHLKIGDTTMKYKDHRGKEIKVSDARYGKMLADERNNPIWLDFRLKHLKFCKEELVMNPSYNLMFRNEGESPLVMREVIYYPNKGLFSGGFYMGRKQYFNSPEAAYDYAKSITE